MPEKANDELTVTPLHHARQDLLAMIWYDLVSPSEPLSGHCGAEDEKNQCCRVQPLICLIDTVSLASYNYGTCMLHSVYPQTYVKDVPLNLTKSSGR